MSFDEFKFWFVVVGQLINSVASGGLWMYVRYGDRNKQIDARFGALEAEIDRRADEQDRRLSRLEGVIERAPTHDDLGGLYDKLNVTAQSVAQMNGQLQAMNDNLRLILNRIADRGMQ